MTNENLLKNSKSKDSGAKEFFALKSAIDILSKRVWKNISFTILPQIGTTSNTSKKSQNRIFDAESRNSNSDMCCFSFVLEQ